jgi:hypothetical protein
VLLLGVNIMTYLLLIEPSYCGCELAGHNDEGLNGKLILIEGE